MRWRRASSRVDLGAGDSGYKRTMGAAAGYALGDLLFVRNSTAARLLPGWGAPLMAGRRLAHG